MPLTAIKISDEINGQRYQVDGSVEGERVRRRIKCRNQREADEAAFQIEKQYRHQLLYGPSVVVTFHHAAAEYVKEGGEGRFLPPLMKKFKNVKTIKLITGADIRKAAKEIYPKAQPGTWNRQVIAPSSAVINFAHGYGWCNPIRVKGFFVKKVNRPYADIEWLLAFREHAISLEIKTLATFMFVTGARIAEAINLRTNNIDLNNGFAVLKDTKNHEDRIVLLPNILIQELAQLNNNPVFGFIDRQGHRKQWEATIQKANIRRLTAHEAGRHAFGKFAHDILESSLDAAVAGGWKSRQLFESRYAHANGKHEIISEALNKIIK